MISNGSYEFKIYQAVPADTGIEQPELAVSIHSCICRFER